MNTWKVILATLVIFGAGVITGGLLVSYSDRVLHPASPKPPARPIPPGPAGRPIPGVAPNRLPAPMPVPLRKAFVDQLERELSLSAAQRERIEAIISSGQERTRQAWQVIEPRMRRELTDTRARIRTELTPDQQVRFEELMRQRTQRRPVPAPGRPGEGLPTTNSPADPK